MVYSPPKVELEHLKIMPIPESSPSESSLAVSCAEVDTSMTQHITRITGRWPSWDEHNRMRIHPRYSNAISLIDNRANISQRTISYEIGLLMNALVNTPEDTTQIFKTSNTLYGRMTRLAARWMEYEYHVKWVCQRIPFIRDITEAVRSYNDAIISFDEYKECARTSMFLCTKL